MERGLERARKSQPTLEEFGVHNREPEKSTHPSKDLVQRVTGVLLAASRQLPLDLLGAAEFEAFVDCFGGTVDKSKTEYVKLLPGVWANFLSVHKATVAELDRDRRREPNYAFEWWWSVENGSVVDLRKRRLSLASLFLDPARAFLLIQASFASAERLFGDGGYQEGTCRQGTGSSVTEMLLMVRSYVVAHLNRPSRQAGFISNRA